MKNNEKFLVFLEAVKTDENAALIDIVIKGFNTCYENKMYSDMAPMNAIMPMQNNIPSSNIPRSNTNIDLTDIDVEDAELPEEPNIGDQDVRTQATGDIMKIVDFLKNDPRGAAILKEILEKVV